MIDRRGLGPTVGNEFHIRLDQDRFLAPFLCKGYNAVLAKTYNQGLLHSWDFYIGIRDTLMTLFNLYLYNKWMP